jgi:hypothetical protein
MSIVLAINALASTIQAKRIVSVATLKTAVVLGLNSGAAAAASYWQAWFRVAVWEHLGVPRVQNYWESHCEFSARVVNCPCDLC